MTNGYLLMKYIDRLDPYIKTNKLTIRISYDGFKISNNERLFMSGQKTGLIIQDTIKKLFTRYKNNEIRLFSVFTLDTLKYITDTFKEFEEYVETINPKLYLLFCFQFNAFKKFTKEIELQYHDTMEELTNLNINFYKKYDRTLIDVYNYDRTCCIDALLFSLKTKYVRYKYTISPTLDVIRCPSFPDNILTQYEQFSEYLDNHIKNKILDKIKMREYFKCKKCDVLYCFKCEHYTKEKDDSCNLWRFFDKYNRKYQQAVT
jgi:hypothetical protein